MTTFSTLKDLSEERIYKDRLKKALSLVKDKPAKVFYLYKSFQVGPKKIPVLIVDFEFDLPKQIKAPGKKEPLAPTAIGRCFRNAQDEIVLEARSGRVPYVSVVRYCAGVSGTPVIWMPPGTTADDDEDAPAPVVPVVQAQPQPQAGGAAGPGAAMARGNPPPPPVGGKGPPLPKPIGKPAAASGQAFTELLKQKPRVKALDLAEPAQAAVSPQLALSALEDPAKAQALAQQDETAFVKSLTNALTLRIDKHSPAELQLTPAKIANLGKALGAKAAACATALLESMGNNAPANDPLFRWAMDNADVAHINGAAKEKGVAATTYDMLWRNGRADDIAQLVAAGWDTGQPKRGGQGYSGFTMPIAHQAAGWLHALDRTPEQLKSAGLSVPDEDLLKKPDGPQAWAERQAMARTVLGAIGKRDAQSGGQTAIMLSSYEDVKKSPVMAQWKKQPGTFWGFENVRMPFVQHARESTTESGDKGGDMVLRMMDMWTSLGKLTARIKDPQYDELMKNPGPVIERLVREALDAPEVKERATGGDNDYARQYEREVRSFLKRLAAERHIDDNEVIEARGNNATSGKYMGAQLCRHGLDWLKDNGKVLYYCLDGIAEEDFLSYRSVKYEQMRSAQVQGKPPGAHDKVITLVELRHIVRSWSSLRNTVRFTKLGQPIADQDALVARWARAIEQDKAGAGARPLPKSPSEFPPELQQELKGLGVQPDMPAEAAFSVARGALGIRRAVGAQEPAVLTSLLRHKTCEPLVKAGFLHEALIRACEGLVQVSSDPGRAEDAARLRQLVVAEAKKLRSPSLAPLFEQWARPR